MSTAPATSIALVDTHAHLTWHSFTDVPELLERAQAVGVGRILSVASDIATSEAAIAQALQYQQVFASVGIHPNDLQEDSDLNAIQLLAKRHKVVAIGETGLDYYRKHTSPAQQKQSLKQHLCIAADMDLPIIIHNREADSELLTLLREWKDRIRGVLHCFSGGRELATEALALGYYLSFAGNLTYPSAVELRALAKEVPGDRLLVETDSPFLAPVPHRRSRNEPAFVAHTLTALAACRDEEPVALAEQIVANAATLFRW